jgi:DNA-binding NarL/FixJ family response regulator
MMRERAEALGGALEIESIPGAGTRVTASLPRHSESESTIGRRVLLVDDHPLFLEGLANLVTGRGLTVVGAASDGLEAQEKARALRPDVILMDIEMPHCGGLEATRRIKAELPETKIIMLTVSGEEWHLFDALQSGASGYLLKSLEASELTSLLEELLRGEVSISPSLANKMLEAFTRHKAPPAQPPGLHPASERPLSAEPAELTARQAQILRLVAEGMQYKQVALQLGLTEITIKYHMGEILARLHLASRREAIRYWQETHPG